LLVIDCIYYKGVIDGVNKYLKDHPKNKAYFVYNEVPKQKGTYMYFD